MHLAEWRGWGEREHTVLIRRMTPNRGMKGQEKREDECKPYHRHGLCVMSMKAAAVSFKAH